MLEDVDLVMRTLFNKTYYSRNRIKDKKFFTIIIN
jgi:hypothetical protein